MSAEVLRRAAALMRERAEVAVSGPWIVDPDEEAMVMRPDGPDGWDGYGVAVILSDSDDQYASTPHIASWHPAVALKIADWLDSVADAHEPPDGGPGNRGRTITIVDDAHAEVIARAYLGESS